MEYYSMVLMAHPIGMPSHEVFVFLPNVNHYGIELYMQWAWSLGKKRNKGVYLTFNRNVPIYQNEIP